MNLDYEKQTPNFGLGKTMRGIIAQPNRVTKHNQEDYLNLFEGIELEALRNNMKASEMATGFIRDVHYRNLMSGLAPTLLERLVGKIANKVYIEESTTEEETTNTTTLKDKFSNAKLSSILKKSFSFSISTGRAINVVDFTNDNVVVRTFDIFRTKLNKINDELKDAYFYLDVKNGRPLEKYFLMEHRYFNGDNQPCKRYELIFMRWNNQDLAPAEVVAFDKVENIPDKMKEYYKAKGFTFLHEYILEGFNDSLGVFEINNTAVNLLYPYVDVPTSQYQYIQDLLLEYDTTRTYKEIDKHLGRGRVVRPEHMQSFGAGVGNVHNVAAMILPRNQAKGEDDMLFTTYPSTKLEDNKPLSIQFDLRTEQWRNEISGLVGDICSAFGLSIVDYDPRLLQTGQRTDDEINAMTDITRSTVEEKRELATESINEMLKLIARLYNVNDNVFIRWSLSSILNPTKNNALISTQLQNGTISHEEAVKRANPDYTSKELQEELKRINADKEQAKANTITTQFDEF